MLETVEVSSPRSPGGRRVLGGAPSCSGEALPRRAPRQQGRSEFGLIHAYPSLLPADATRPRRVGERTPRVLPNARGPVGHPRTSPLDSQVANRRPGTSDASPQVETEGPGTSATALSSRTPTSADLLGRAAGRIGD